VLEVGISDESVIMPALQEMAVYFGTEIAKRGTKRGDDLISFLLDARIEGQPLSPAHLQGTLRLLLVAGIDTTWSGIGSSLWHLATHPEDRRRLGGSRADPTAIEEFLRAYAPVTMARGGEGDHRGWLPVQGKGRYCSPSAATATLRNSRRLTACSSTEPRIRTRPSAWAGTAAWARTSRAWR
jgi:hypothetical protein